MLGLDRPDDIEITGQFPAGYERSPKGECTVHGETSGRPGC